MTVFGIILAIIGILATIAAFGYFIKVAFIEGEYEPEWYTDHFKLFGGAFFVSGLCSALALSVGSGFARIVGFITIALLIIYFITFLVRARMVSQ